MSDRDAPVNRHVRSNGAESCSNSNSETDNQDGLEIRNLSPALCDAMQHSAKSNSSTVTEATQESTDKGVLEASSECDQSNRNTSGTCEDAVITDNDDCCGPSESSCAFKKRVKRDDFAISRKRKCDSDTESQGLEAKSSHDKGFTDAQASSSGVASNPATANITGVPEMDVDSDEDSDQLTGVDPRSAAAQRAEESLELDESSSSDEQETFNESNQQILISEAELDRMLEPPPPPYRCNFNIVTKLRDRERCFGICRFRTSAPRNNHRQPASTASPTSSTYSKNVEADVTDNELYKPPAEASRSLGSTQLLRTHLSHREELHGSFALVRRFELQARLSRHDGCVNSLNFSESGTLLASGSDDLRVICWDWQRRRVAFEFASGHKSNVFQSRFIPGSNDLLLATCSRDGQVRLAELSSTGKCMRTRRLVKHRDAAHKLSTFSDDSNLLLSCGEDAVVYQMDFRHHRPSRLLTAKNGSHKIALYSVHANPANANEFCIAGRDQYVRVYDRRFIAADEGSENKQVKRFCPRHLAPESGDGATSVQKKKRAAQVHVTCAVYNYNGTQILGSYNDEDIYLFDCRSDYAEEFSQLSSPAAGSTQPGPSTADFEGLVDSRRAYKGHRNNQTVKGVNFYGPRSEFVVSGSDCGYVFLWDVESANLVNCLHADQVGAVNVLEPHPFLPILATSGLEHDVKLWFPSATEPLDLTKISNLDGQSPPRSVRTLITNNTSSRRAASIFAVDLDSEMLWYLMRQLRRSMHAPVGEQQESDSSSDDEEEEENDEDDDDDQDDDDEDADDDPGGHPSDRRAQQFRSCVAS